MDMQDICPSRLKVYVYREGEKKYMVDAPRFGGRSCPSIIYLERFLLDDLERIPKLTKIINGNKSGKFKLSPDELEVLREPIRVNQMLNTYKRIAYKIKRLQENSRIAYKIKRLQDEFKIVGENLSDAIGKVDSDSFRREEQSQLESKTTMVHQPPKV